MGMVKRRIRKPGKIFFSGRRGFPLLSRGTDRTGYAPGLARTAPVHSFVARLFIARLRVTRLRVGSVPVPPAGAARARARAPGAFPSAAVQRVARDF